MALNSAYHETLYRYTNIHKVFVPYFVISDGSTWSLQLVSEMEEICLFAVQSHACELSLPY